VTSHSTGNEPLFQDSEMKSAKVIAESPYDPDNAMLRG